jgi:hypothetical protein
MKNIKQRKIILTAAILSRLSGTKRVTRIPPVDSVQHVGELSGRNSDHAVHRCRPDEPPPLQSLGVQRHANPVMPDDLEQIALPSPENKQVSGMRITLQRLLHKQRQAVHPTPHVRSANSQPNPHVARNRDHRRTRAFTTATASSGGTEAGMRARVPWPIITSIAVSFRSLEPTAPDETTTSENPVGAIPNSRRHR